MSRVASFAPPTNELPPPTPPKPERKTGVERIVEMQAVKGEYNEIIISDEGSVGDYAQYCNKLLQVCWTECIMMTAGLTHGLQDDAMLFVSVKSAEAEQVPKVLQVVEETKRIRYKAGMLFFVHSLKKVNLIMDYFLKAWTKKKACISMSCTTRKNNEKDRGLSTSMTTKRTSMRRRKILPFTSAK